MSACTSADRPSTATPISATRKLRLVRRHRALPALPRLQGALRPEHHRRRPPDRRRRQRRGQDREARRAERIHPMQLAETYTRSYFEDMDALNVLRPDISRAPPATSPSRSSSSRRSSTRGYAYEAERLGLLRRGEVPRLRQALRPAGRRARGRRARRGEPGEAASGGLRPLEEGRAGHIIRWTRPGARDSPAGTSSAPPCP